MSEEKNENCLAGMKCPECGSLGAFDIAIDTVMRFTDDGEDFFNDKGSARNWDDNSYCFCCACGKSGKVKDFKI